MTAAFGLEVRGRAAHEWQTMPGLPGRLRFFPHGARSRGRLRLPSSSDRPLHQTAASPELVLGYGAGNVPGAALAIALLAQSTALAGGHPPPAILVKITTTSASSATCSTGPTS